MASYTSVAARTTSVQATSRRYRQAEQALWEHYGLQARERFIELDSPAVRLRILEVGSGDPLLFVHGTVGPGAWPALIRELPGFRASAKVRRLRHRQAPGVV
jgi:hypothetical protein